MTPIENSDIGELLQQRLRSAVSVRNLVADRIRPDALEQSDPMPAIRYLMVTTDSQVDLSGASGFAFTRMQYDCYGETRRQANLVAKAVVDVLHGFEGDLSPDCHVEDCTLDNKYDRTDPPASGSSKFRYRRVVDFNISHTEPTPSLSTT